MATTALVLAIIGVVLSLLSLGWQILSHVLTGPRLRVTVKLGLAGSGGSITWAPGRRPDRASLERHIGEGYNRPVVHVAVRNVGRMPATVHVIRFDQQVLNYRPIRDIAAGPQLPVRVDTHDSLEWLVDAAAIATFIEAGRDVLEAPEAVATVIETGTGEQVRAREQFTMSDMAVWVASIDRTRPRGNRHA